MNDREQPTMHEKHIVQIMPTSGWLAETADAAGKHHLDELIGWALVRHTDGDEKWETIEGIIALEACTLTRSEADNDGIKFVRYISPSDSAYARAEHDDAALDDDKRRVLTALSGATDGLSIDRLRLSAKMGRDRCQYITELLATEGQAEWIKLSVSCGKNRTRKVDGVRPKLP
jgi:hypothetical protein